MREYEVVYIFDPSLAREAVDDKLAAYHAVLDGEIATVDHWGVRPLAFPIRKLKTAYYAVVQLSADPTGLPEFERLVKLDEDALRYLVVLNEGLPTTGDSILAPRPSVEEDAEAQAQDGETGEAHDEGAGAAAPADGAADEDSGDDAEDDSGSASAQDAQDAGSGDAADADARSADAGASRPAPEADADGPAPMSPTAPPVFTGPHGRRRRHDGPPVVLLNYKDVTTLSRFLTEQGKILPKRTTKVSARFQRQLGRAVKRARHLALLPYVRDHEA